MSETGAQKFMEGVEQSQQLQDALNADLAGAQDPVAATIDFARRHGFDLDPQDLSLQAPPQQNELSEDDLDEVVGGLRNLSAHAINGNSLGGERGIIIINGHTASKGIIVIDG